MPIGNYSLTRRSPMKPLDERMRETAKAQLRPPALWNDIRRWADQVTSLLIANEELTKQNQELMARYAKLEEKVDAGLMRLKAHAWTAAIVAGAAVVLAIMVFGNAAQTVVL